MNTTLSFFRFRGENRGRSCSRKLSACIILLVGSSLLDVANAQSNAYNGADGRGSAGSSNSPNSAAGPSAAQAAMAQRQAAVEHAEAVIGQIHATQEQERAQWESNTQQAVLGALSGTSAASPSTDAPSDEANGNSGAAISQQPTIQDGSAQLERQQEQATLAANRDEFEGLIGSFGSSPQANGASLAAAGGTNSPTINSLANDLTNEVESGNGAVSAKASGSTSSGTSINDPFQDILTSAIGSDSSAQTASPTGSTRVAFFSAPLPESEQGSPVSIPANAVPGDVVGDTSTTQMPSAADLKSLAKGLLNGDSDATSQDGKADSTATVGSTALQQAAPTK